MAAMAAAGAAGSSVRTACLWTEGAAWAVPSRLRTRSALFFSARITSAFDFHCDGRASAIELYIVRSQPLRSVMPPVAPAAS